MSYEYHEYPAWVGKDGEAPRLVQDADEHAALGEGWELPPRVDFIPREQSADFEEYPKWVNGVIVADAAAEADLLAKQPDSERAMLLRIAAERGVKVDGRWSDAKLRAALDALEPSAE